MGSGAILEPLVVIVLLFGGTWINRSTAACSSVRRIRRSSTSTRACSPDSLESGLSSPTAKDALLNERSLSPTLVLLDDARWRKRQIRILSWTFEVKSPNTAVFQERLLSRLLRKFPFLVECWYWALVYWVCPGFPHSQEVFPHCQEVSLKESLVCLHGKFQTYQLGRAFTAVTLQEGTVDVARKHALQLIQIEKSLCIFWEISIQRSFLRHNQLMSVINWVYSFIHIPGTIAFLVWLYYYTTTRNRVDETQMGKPLGVAKGSPAGPLLYQARRRTLAVCNLLAFVIFTLWPCMPPRLLSDKNAKGPDGELGRSYGFVDTVHGVNGAGSVWTENRFCNQYGKHC